MRGGKELKGRWETPGGRTFCLAKRKQLFDRCFIGCLKKLWSQVWGSRRWEGKEGAGEGKRGRLVLQESHSKLEGARMQMEVRGLWQNPAGSLLSSLSPFWGQGCLPQPVLTLAGTSLGVVFTETGRVSQEC